MTITYRIYTNKAIIYFENIDDIENELLEKYLCVKDGELVVILGKEGLSKYLDSLFTKTTKAFVKDRKKLSKEQLLASNRITSSLYKLLND